MIAAIYAGKSTALTGAGGRRPPRIVLRTCP